MALMLVCGALLAVGVAFTLLWSDERLLAPDGRLAPTAPGVGPAGASARVAALRLYAWWASVLTVAGVATGILIAGAGGRLAMRLLAVTSPQSTGRLTEGDATIGRITLEGTVALLVFGALPLALGSAALYLLVAPWLPAGRAAGPVFGGLLLVTIAPFADPLRADNIDFGRLGPGWLSVLVLGGLTVLQGAAVAACAGRLSRSLPLLSRSSLPAAVPPIVLALLLVPLGLLLAAAAAVVALLPRLLPWLLTMRASRPAVVVGRALLAVAVLVALPSCIAAVTSIVTASPR
ncbi:hypothetical protein ABIB37_002384 [Agrococcus sp. UYP10]|uniref:hypothetical protein n=1 Tax=Agrococcus sp. UYP10 TaxID=1756355 RepID=UPI003396555C